MSAAQEAAAGLVGDQEQLEAYLEAGEAAAAEQEQAPSDSEAAAAEQEQHEAATTNLDPQVPDELASFLDEPDFDEEADLEVTAAAEEEIETGEYTDPQLVEERRKRIAAEKKAAHFEELRIRESRGRWKGEIEKYFPLADADTIAERSSSRRGALRMARSEHERLKARLGPLLKQQTEVTDQVIESAAGVAREEAAAAWGKPLTGAQNTAPPEAVARAQHDEKVKNARTLTERIKARLDGDLGPRIA